MGYSVVHADELEDPAWRIGAEEVPARVGTFFRFDPDQTRSHVAGPEGMAFVAIGARRGSYEARGPF